MAALCYSYGGADFCSFKIATVMSPVLSSDRGG